MAKDCQGFPKLSKFFQKFPPLSAPGDAGGSSADHGDGRTASRWGRLRGMAIPRERPHPRETTDEQVYGPTRIFGRAGHVVGRAGPPMSRFRLCRSGRAVSRLPTVTCAGLRLRIPHSARRPEAGRTRHNQGKNHEYPQTYQLLRGGGDGGRPCRLGFRERRGGDGAGPGGFLFEPAGPAGGLLPRRPSRAAGRLRRRRLSPPPLLGRSLGSSALQLVRAAARDQPAAALAPRSGLSAGRRRRSGTAW